MNLCFALCFNLKSRWSWGEIWRAPLPVFHLTGEKATGMKRLKKVFFLGTGADRFVYSSIIRQTGWCKDGKMRSLKQFTIAQAISLHRISFFSHFFASRHSQNISVSTQNTSLAPPKRDQRKKSFHTEFFSLFNFNTLWLPQTTFDELPKCTTRRWLRWCSRKSILCLRAL